MAAVIAHDSFTRTVANGWGSADLGGLWTPTGVLTQANTSVTNGQGGAVVIQGGLGDMRLNAISVADVQSGISYVIVSGPDRARYVGIKFRVTGSNGYEMSAVHQPGGGVSLELWKDGGGSEATAISPTAIASWSAGTSYSLKAEVIGSSSVTVRGKVWPTGTAEPDWQLFFTETPTADLRGPGAVGITATQNSGGTGSLTLQFDNYEVIDLNSAEESTGLMVGSSPVIAVYVGATRVHRPT